MGVDTNLFPKVSSNMVTPDLSKLTKPQPKVDIGQTSKVVTKNKYRKAPTKTIHDLKRSYDNKQKVKSFNQADLLTKDNLSKKTTDELLDEIREQQIEFFKRGLCLKCKAITQPEGSLSSKRPRDQPPRPPSAP